MDKKIKIFVHQDWDSMPSGKNKSSSYFSGRKVELELLTSIIEYKDSGSILVAAPRGTGKTDLVYKALEEAKLKNKTLFPIIFNANHFSEKTDDKDLSILKSLINRMYSTYISKKRFHTFEVI